MISEENQQLINSLILCSLGKVNYYLWYLILDWISILPHKQYVQNNDISGLSILCVIFHLKHKWLVAVNDHPLDGFVCIAMLSPITNCKPHHKDDMRKHKIVQNTCHGWPKYLNRIIFDLILRRYNNIPFYFFEGRWSFFKKKWNQVLQIISRLVVCIQKLERTTSYKIWVHF